VIALIKLVTGAFVLAIMASSTLEAEESADRTTAATRRLASLQPSAPGGWGIVPALAILLGLVLVLGIKSEVALDRLPDLILQSGLMLGVGGVVAVVLAREPLRLAVGTMLGVIAFELVYARLDPGLVVTGALAGFQLLFALVASYFVGERLGSGQELETRPAAEP
jgi:hypothetical protein